VLADDELSEPLIRWLMQPEVPDLPTTFEELLQKPTWMAEAACRGEDPALFFPERGDWLSIKKARAICRTCPVRQPCTALALSDPLTVGVWGGTTRLERRQMRSPKAS
jgi:WhiB family transcriptional regulator, redox-sensing transcriptional regulator